jgi:hypothetical protein
VPEENPCIGNLQQEFTSATEVRLLQLLCQISPGPERSEIFEQILSEPHGYHWRIPEQEVIFQALVQLSGLSGEALRGTLPAQLTRMGFPDIDLTAYFRPLETSDKSDLDRAKQITAALIASQIVK